MFVLHGRHLGWLHRVSDSANLRQISSHVPSRWIRVEWLHYIRQCPLLDAALIMSEKHRWFPRGSTIQTRILICMCHRRIFCFSLLLKKIKCYEIYLSNHLCSHPQVCQLHRTQKSQARSYYLDVVGLVSTNNSQQSFEEAERGAECLNQPWQAERNWLLSNGMNPLTWKERCAKDSKTWIETFTKEDEAMTANENGSIGIAKVNLVRTFLWGPS